MEAVDQIEVDVVRPQPPQLLLQHPLGAVVRLVHAQGKELSGDLHLVPDPVLRQNPAQGHLRVAVVIGVSGVVVVDAVFQGIEDHLLRLAVVHLGLVAVVHRQAHEPKAQPGDLLPVKCDVAHISYLLSPAPQASDAFS